MPLDMCVGTWCRAGSLGALLAWTVNRKILMGRLLGFAETEKLPARLPMVFPG